jgi:uncharacterized protein YjiK
MLCLGALPACTQPTTNITDGKFTYLLTQPTQQWKLDKELEEVSGLTYVNEQQLAAVDDEKGSVFLFDTEKGKIKEEIKFGKKGDYEGIEVIDGVYYVLRSDGDIFEIHSLLESPEVEKYETELSRDNDVEGLGYDAEGHLLVACKNGGELKGEENSASVMVYRYRAGDDKLVPFLYRSAELFQRHLEGEKKFRVSAVAQHPVTQHYYLLASANRSLVILNKKSEVIDLAYLNRTTFAQPEGICFAPDGTLYISNEARSGKATILQFAMSNLQ